ncbi:glycosyltransferase [Flavobacterium rakeshii]|uniref:Glycosyltransferase n=1 Tax=Flavobacterium rakeshii TaxID=1038845 RepID=A0A6N8HDB7_9FLAO|nr:glycosyltransferase family A protein [Flavobacterium rakeshii]MUV04000.1 glycosyltransferase [Flavobacterium rakeshii]
MPYFSVVIPVYNKQTDIKATLLSALKQSFEDFELIVINDGSRDDSESEILSVTDERLIYIKTENRGVSQARNLGIEKATGTYIAFLDADDYWYPNHLKVLYELCKAFPKAGAVTTNYEFLHPDGYIENTLFNDIDKAYVGIVNDFFKSSLKYRLIWTTAVAVKKKVFDSIGNFDNNITLGAGEDTDMWTRIALKYPIAYNDTITATYRLEGGNRVSHTQTLKRVFAKLDKFKDEEKTNKSLQKFLDLYRASYALKHKLAGDKKTFRFYYNSIANKKNISNKSAVLLRLPKPLLMFFYWLKQKLKKSNIHFDIYN